MAAAVTLSMHDLEDVVESPEVEWFEKATLTRIPPPELLPDGALGDRLWRARGWSTED